MDEQNKRDEKIVDGCKPCEIYDAFNRFCAELARAPRAKRVDTESGPVTIKMGENACGILSNYVYDGKVDPDEYYNTLLEIYGEDAVRAAAIRHLAGPDATQKREKPAEKQSEGGTGQGGPPQPEVPKNSDNSGQIRAQRPDVGQGPVQQSNPPARAVGGGVNV